MNVWDGDIIQYSEKLYYICPWVGTKEISTIVQLFSFGLKEYLDICSVSAMPCYINFTSGLDNGELHKKLEDLKCENDNTDKAVIVRKLRLND